MTSSREHHLLATAVRTQHCCADPPTANITSRSFSNTHDLAREPASGGCPHGIARIHEARALAEALVPFRALLPPARPHPHAKALAGPGDGGPAPRNSGNSQRQGRQGPDADLQEGSSLYRPHHADGYI